MAKKSVVAGEYIIEIPDNGRVDVLRVPRNSCRIIREIIKEKGLPIDENWNKQDYGRNLIKKFGDGTTARFKYMLYRFYITMVCRTPVARK